MQYFVEASTDVKPYIIGSRVFKLGDNKVDSTHYFFFLPKIHRKLEMI